MPPYEFEQPRFEFVPPPIDGNLPEDFSLKESLLRCREADNVYHGVKPKSAIPKLIDDALAESKWLDAYELQRLAEEYGQPIDPVLQRSLGLTMIAWATPAFRQVFPEDRRDRHVRPMDMLVFFEWSDRHLARYPEDTEAAMPHRQALCDLLVEYMIAQPYGANHDFIAMQLDNPGDRMNRRLAQRFRRIFAGTTAPEQTRQLLQDAVLSLAETSPSDAFLVATFADGGNQIEAASIEQAIETALNNTDTRALLSYELHRDGWADPEHPFVDDPSISALDISHIFPDAPERIRQIMLRRRLELLQADPDLARGTRNEWRVLYRTYADSQRLGVPLPDGVIERIVAIASGREVLHPKSDARVSDFLKVLFELRQKGITDFETAFGAATDLTERYLTSIDKAANVRAAANTEDALEDFEGYYAEFIAHNNAINFVMRFAEVALEHIKEYPNQSDVVLDHIIDANLLREIVRLYQEKEVTPGADQITKERLRLVTTYPNDAFVPAKRSEWNMKVRHPERGPRSMIYRYPLELSSKHLVLSSLGMALNSDRLGTLAEWQECYQAGDIVKYFPSF